MTRKRFVKLLMAKGYSRNEANRTADVAIVLKPSYEEAYHYITAGDLAGLRDIDIKAVEDAMRQVVDTVQRIVKAFAVGVQAFTDAVHAEMAKDRTD